MTDGPTARGDEAGSSIGPKPSIAEVAAWLRRAADEGEGTEDLSPTPGPGAEPAGPPRGEGPADEGAADEGAVAEEQPSGLEPDVAEPVREAGAPPDSTVPEVEDSETALPEQPASPPPADDTSLMAAPAGTDPPAVPSADPPAWRWAVAVPEDRPIDGPSAEAGGDVPEAKGDASAATVDAPEAEAAQDSEAHPSPGEPIPRPDDRGSPERTGPDLAPTDLGTPTPTPTADPPDDSGSVLESARPDTHDDREVADPVVTGGSGGPGTPGAAAAAIDSVPASEDAPTPPRSTSPSRVPTSLFDLDLAELAARARASAASGAPVKGQPPKIRTPIELPAPTGPEPVPYDVGAEPRPEPLAGPDRSGSPAPRHPLIAASTALDLSKETASETVPNETVPNETVSNETVPDETVSGGAVSGDVEMDESTVADDPAETAAPARSLRLPSNLHWPTGLRLPSSLQSQRTRYPRGQLQERIGILRRVRAMLGVVVVTVLLGVAAGAAIGAFLLFLAFAVRGAIISG